MPCSPRLDLVGQNSFSSHRIRLPEKHRDTATKQKNIAEAVTVEFRHGTEICGILLTVEQFRDARFQLVSEFLHLFHSLLIVYLSPPPVEMCLILRRKNALTGVSVPVGLFP